MSNQKLTYTKAIRAGRLKATEMAVGESVTGTLKDFKENKFGGANPILEVNGKDVEVFPAGNLKFLAQNVADGKLNLGTYIVITRTEDKMVQFKGQNQPVSQFSVSQENGAVATPKTTAPANTTSIADKLAAIRNNRGANQ